MQKKTADHRAEVGWGMLALFDDQMVERRGTCLVPAALMDDFELVAFFEAVRFARGHGRTPEHISFCIDDDPLYMAGFRMHPENYASKRTLDAFLRRIARIARALYTPELHADVIACLRTSHITKIKSHKFCVYLNRVDYLARSSVQGVPAEELQPYESWLAGGFPYYDETGERRTWHPPFSDLLRSSLLPEHPSA